MRTAVFAAEQVTRLPGSRRVRRCFPIEPLAEGILNAKHPHEPHRRPDSTLIVDALAVSALRKNGSSQITGKSDST
jgi:hypothetical protein